jgi:hypothetical protein
MTTERMLPNESAPHTRPMSLEGQEALELYLAEIGRNVEAINGQATLLQTAFTERKELLQEIYSSG